MLSAIGTFKVSLAIGSTGLAFALLSAVVGVANLFFVLSTAGGITASLTLFLVGLFSTGGGGITGCATAVESLTTFGNVGWVNEEVSFLVEAVSFTTVGCQGGVALT